MRLQVKQRRMLHRIVSHCNDYSCHHRGRCKGSALTSSVKVCDANVRTMLSGVCTELIPSIAAHLSVRAAAASRFKRIGVVDCIAAGRHPGIRRARSALRSLGPRSLPPPAVSPAAASLAVSCISFTARVCLTPSPACAHVPTSFHVKPGHRVPVETPGSGSLKPGSLKARKRRHDFQNSAHECLRWGRPACLRWGPPAARGRGSVRQAHCPRSTPATRCMCTSVPCASGSRGCGRH